MKRLFAIGTGLVAFGLSFLFAHAAAAVTVGPVRLEYSVNPGDVVTGDVLLLNEGSNNQTFYSSFERFTENDNGEKLFLKEPSGLSSWFEIPSAVPLNAGEQRHIPFTLRIPSDAPPGGHFAVMWWGTGNPNAPEGLSIVTRAGILVYLRVSGDIQESASFAQFSSGKKFFIAGPINFSANVKNSGNVAITPKGRIAISNIFGVEKASVPFNPNGAIVLPGNTKHIASAWSFGSWLWGPYKASAQVTYGEGEETTEAGTWVFVFSPIPTLILLGILFLVFVFPPFIRGYNKRVIARANKTK
jgi:hypothetical protein